MKGHMWRVLTAGVAAVLASAWMVQVAGQEPGKPEKADKKPQEAAKPGKPWTGKTAWGDPDIQGTWSHFDETPVQTKNPDPVSRAAEEAANAKRYGAEGKGEGPGGGMAHEQDRPYSPKRTALVVDPPNGRIPLLPGKTMLRDFDKMGDSWVFHAPGDRCVTRGMPAGLFTGLGYGRAFQILQAPGYVVIFPEMIHEPLIVPLDGRAHAGATIKQWNGDSRGHWEGQTLVIDTTNYNDKGVIIGGAGRPEVPQSSTLHVVQRLTRVDEKTIDHKITFEDPATFTQPWTVELPHNLDPSYTIFEYACHEGNTRYMEGSLRQGRVRDAEAAKHGKGTPK